ncbi:MAG: SGNH/GDSL hydrolase family protein, partial [Chloroflexota bacterium]
ALGSNWGGSAEEWANQYDQIILTLMNEYQILPVLWTVSDTPHLNIEIRTLAAKYQLPLVEWASIGIPYLSADGVHFTVEGWTVRSRVGLEVLSQLRNMIESYDRIVH